MNPKTWENCILKVGFDDEYEDIQKCGYPEKSMSKWQKKAKREKLMKPGCSDSTWLLHIVFLSSRYRA